MKNLLCQFEAASHIYRLIFFKLPDATGAYLKLVDEVENDRLAKLNSWQLLVSGQFMSAQNIGAIALNEEKNNVKDLHVETGSVCLFYFLQ